MEVGSKIRTSPSSSPSSPLSALSRLPCSRTATFPARRSRRHDFGSGGYLHQESRSTCC
ncbi:hypothetical protein VPH35_137415 [Triticum aestivum]